MSAVFRDVPTEQIFKPAVAGAVPEIAECYPHTWWDQEQEELRGLLTQWYVEMFDAETGFYTALREDIKANGILDPVVVTKGEPFNPEKLVLPPGLPPYICEGAGGSRLIVAQELGLETVPCIVNDRTGTEVGTVLHSALEAAQLFAGEVSIDWDPVVARHKSFSHLPELSMGEQKTIRQRVKQAVYERWQDWLADQRSGEQRACAQDIRDDFTRDWKGGLPETPCGAGSKLEETRPQRQKLAEFVRRHNIRSVVDVGAGDLNWVGAVDWDVDYLPLDLVPRHEAVRQFDILTEVPPKADMVMFLWVGNHMTAEQVKVALGNIRASGSKWLVMTYGTWMWPAMDLKPVEECQIRIHRDQRRTWLRLVRL